MAEMTEYMDYDWHNNVIRHHVIIDKKTIPFKTKESNKDILIKELRTVIKHLDDVELRNTIPTDDKTLEKFLYARKFDLEESLELIKNYYLYRKRNPEIFRNFNLDADDIFKSLENGLPGVLQSKDRKGRCVLVFTGTNWDCSYTLFSIYRAFLFSIEHLINNIHNQANGFVVIVDWTNFTFRQSTNLKPSVLKLMIEGLQDCFPVRFKGIHFIGQPWYVEAALTVIKPFLKEKIKERIYVHGNNLSMLHELVHKDILPADLGGEQPSYNSRSWLDTLEKDMRKENGLVGNNQEKCDT